MSQSGLAPSVAWPRKRIGDVAEVVGGGTPSTKDSENFGGGIPWLTPRDLSSWSSRYISSGERTLTDRGLKASSARLVPRNTVLVSSRAPIGYVALAALPMATNQGFRSMILKEGNNPEFFYYVMRTLKSALEAAASGTTFKEIAGSVLAGVTVPVPPLDDQESVAKVLSALDQRRESNIRLIRVLDLLVLEEFATRFVRSLATGDWPAAQLGDLGLVVGGGTPSTTHSEYWADSEGLVWLTPRDMTALSAPVVYDSARRITERGLAESSARLLPPGAVLYTSRATIGLSAIARTAVTTNQGFISVIPNPDFSSEFVLMLLRRKAEEILANANGSTFLEINKTNFRSISFALPSLGERHEFDRIAAPVFDLIAALDRESQTLARLRDLVAPMLTTGRLRRVSGA